MSHVPCSYNSEFFLSKIEFFSYFFENLSAGTVSWNWTEADLEGHLYTFVLIFWSLLLSDKTNKVPLVDVYFIKYNNFKIIFSWNQNINYWSLNQQFGSWWFAIHWHVSLPHGMTSFVHIVQMVKESVPSDDKKFYIFIKNTHFEQKWYILMEIRGSLIMISWCSWDFSDSCRERRRISYRVGTLGKIL